MIESKGDHEMQATQTQTRQWRVGIAKITLTDHAIKADYAGHHESVALSEITGVDRSGIWPGITLTIRTRGGSTRLPMLWRKQAAEIVAALGF
jgi:hypothetical protein